MTQRVAGNLSRLSRPAIKDVNTYGIDHLVTHCTHCCRAIYKNHKYYWQKGNGLVHIDCDDPFGHEIKDTT